MYITLVVIELGRGDRKITEDEIFHNDLLSRCRLHVKCNGVHSNGAGRSARLHFSLSENLFG
jgi:hypothetical protein